MPVSEQFLSLKSQVLMAPGLGLNIRLNLPRESLSIGWRRRAVVGSNPPLHQNFRLVFELVLVKRGYFGMLCVGAEI